MQAKHEWHVWVANGSSINKQNALAQLIFLSLLPHSKCLQCLVLKWLAQKPSNFFSQTSSDKASKHHGVFLAFKQHKKRVVATPRPPDWFGRMVSPLSPLSGLEPFFPSISSRQPEATKVCKNTTVASFGGPPAANASFDATVQLPVGRCCLWTRLAFGKSTCFGSCSLG